jgi:hypothetical protein
MCVSPFLGIIAKFMDQFNGKMFPGENFFETRTGHDHKMTEAEKSPILPPGIDLQEGIQAHDEVNLGVGTELAAKMLDGLDGIRLSRALQFRFGKGEAGIIGDRPSDHFGPRRGVEDSFFFFVGRVGGRDKKDPVEFEGMGDLFGRPKVAQVNGIESAAEEADLFHVRTCPDP